MYKQRFTKRKYFQYLCCEISFENEKGIQQKLAKFAQILGTISKTSVLALVQKFSRIKVNKTPALPLFYMQAKFGPLEKKEEKKIFINRHEIFQKNSRLHPS
jgi:hypothetical protein